MKSFFLALRFLTILPWGGTLTPKDEEVVAAGKYFPLVGLVIGLLLWGFYSGVERVFPQTLAVGLLLLFWVVLTGALHLDGLSDCLDGLYGGGDAEERLRIMKDVHTGTMGTAGLVLFLGMKYLLLWELLTSSFPGYGILLVPVVARWTPVLLGSFFDYARPEGGLGAALVQGTGKKELFWSGLLAWVSLAVIGGFWGLGAGVTVSLWAVLCGWFFKKKINGVTGDVLGAVIETGEGVALLYLVGVSSHG